VLKVWRGSDWGAELFARELEVVQHLQGHGLSPELIDYGSGPELTWVRSRRMTPLTDRLVGATASDRISVGQRLLEQVAALHAIGICHRDLQMTNVVVDDRNIPLFIDLEIAAWTDPAKPCYDLEGPSSGVEIPEVHHDIGLHDGVWWDAPWPAYDIFGATTKAPPPFLGAVFGPSTLYRPHARSVRQ